MTSRLDAEVLAALVGAIYEAAIEPERWRGALPRLVEAMGAERAFLGFTSPTRGHTLTTMSHEWDDAMLRRWQEEFAGHDPWYQRSGNLPTGAVVQGLDVLPWDDLRAVEVHEALFHPAGIDDLICASVANRGDSFDFVTVHRDAPFASAEMRVMRFLAPHLVRAAQLHDKLSFLSDLQTAHEALLDRLPYGVILLDAAGMLVRANREAERILAAADGLRVRGGAVEAVHADAQRALAAALAATCTEGARAGAESGALFPVPRRSLAARPYQALLAPVGGSTRERVFEPVAPRVAAALVVSDPDAAAEPAATTLRRLFGLTPALARLAAALASGRTIAEYAESSAITEGTARWHLKQLFVRTGTSRQAELVRLLLASVAALDARSR
jgi:DNA-binding CsgD family transcriptional regulator/PAS domain-containing protein